jgi:hypothetical protein
MIGIGPTITIPVLMSLSENKEEITAKMVPVNIKRKPIHSNFNPIDIGIDLLHPFQK